MKTKILTIFFSVLMFLASFLFSKSHDIKEHNLYKKIVSFSSDFVKRNKVNSALILKKEIKDKQQDKQQDKLLGNRQEIGHQLTIENKKLKKNGAEFKISDEISNRKDAASKIKEMAINEMDKAIKIATLREKLENTFIPEETLKQQYLSIQEETNSYAKSKIVSEFEHDLKTTVGMMIKDEAYTFTIELLKQQKNTNVQRSVATIFLQKYPSEIPTYIQDIGVEKANELLPSHIKVTQSDSGEAIIHQYINPVTSGESP